jgi:hypothetical protein
MSERVSAVAPLPCLRIDVVGACAVLELTTCGDTLSLRCCDYRRHMVAGAAWSLLSFGRRRLVTTDAARKVC